MSCSKIKMKRSSRCILSLTCINTPTKIHESYTCFCFLFFFVLMRACTHQHTYPQENQKLQQTLRHKNTQIQIQTQNKHNTLENGTHVAISYNHTKSTCLCYSSYLRRKPLRSTIARVWPHRAANIQHTCGFAHA